MRRSVFLIALIFSLFSCPSYAQETLADGIAAVVNGEVITLSEVRELVETREQALRSTYQGQELIDKIKEMRDASLKDLIDRKLILQAFKKEGFSIPDRIIDQRINELVREEFGGDRNTFIRTLQAQNYTLTKFREVEKEKIIIQAMRQRYASPNMLISPQRIDAYYQSHRSKYATPDEVQLRMIVINGQPFDPASTPENQKSIAEEIHTKLLEGADFEKMAQMYSDDPTRDSGGDWGWIDRSTLNKELTDLAFSLKAGGISPVAKIGGSYYILKVDARKNGVLPPLSEIRDQIEKELLQEERIEQQEKWIDSLRAKAYIKTL